MKKLEQAKAQKAIILSKVDMIRYNQAIAPKPPVNVMEQNPYASFFKLFRRKDKKQLLYVVAFFYRRFFMILIITLLPVSSYTQIVAQIVSTSVMHSYLIRVMPFAEPAYNLQEYMNETIVLLAAYPLYSFTDFVYDMDRRIEMGWFLIGCILLCLVLNIILLIVETCRLVKEWIRRRYAMQRRAQYEEMLRMRLAAQQIIDIDERVRKAKQLAASGGDVDKSSNTLISAKTKKLEIKGDQLV